MAHLKSSILFLCTFVLSLSISPPSGFAQAKPVPRQNKPFVRAPHCAPLPALADGIGEAFLEIYKVTLSTLLPHLGYHLQESDADKMKGAIFLSWPLQWAFGTTTGEKARTRKCVPGYVERFHGHRFLLEPQLFFFTHNSPKLGKAFALRPGYRFVYHQEDSLFGFGVGLGGNFKFLENVEASISTELIGQYGECCQPGFFDLAFRYDYLPSQKRHSFALLFGLSYF